VLLRCVVVSLSSMFSKSSRVESSYCSSMAIDRKSSATEAGVAVLISAGREVRGLDCCFVISGCEDVSA
jgi:hypothetical protein